MTSARVIVAATLSVAVCVGSGCSTSERVHRLEPEKNPKKRLRHEGVEYALPRTVVSVTVPVSKVTPKRAAVWNDVIRWYNAECAPFEDDDKKVRRVKHDPAEIAGLYAPELSRLLAPGQLRAGVFVTKPEYKLGKEIAIDTLAEADPDEVYLIDFSRGAFEDRSLTVALSEAGLFTSTESTVKNRGLEYTVKTLQAAASIAGAFVGLAPSPVYPVEAFVATDASPGVAPGDKTKPRLCREKFQDPENPWIKNLRELVLLRVYRSALLTGGLYDGESLVGDPVNDGVELDLHPLLAEGATKSVDKLLPPIDARIKALTAYFGGSKEVVETKLTFLVRPESGGPARFPLLRMDKHQFMLDKADGVTLPPLPEKFASGDPRSVLWLNLTPDPERKEQLAGVVASSRHERGRAIKRGYAYRIPLVVRADVSYGESRCVCAGRGCSGCKIIVVPRPEGSRLVASDSLQIAQYGHVSRLPGHFSGADLRLALKLYPKTGALQSLELKGAPAEFSSEAPGAIQGAATGLVDAVNAKRKAEQEALDKQSELARKQRELELLKIDVEIKEAKAKLGLDQSDE